MKVTKFLFRKRLSKKFMKKLLYIKHSFHNKTKSNDFLQEILKTEYDVEIFDYNDENDSFERFSELSGQEFDTVILFQIMPPVSVLNKFIKYNRIAFFPMYDATHRFNIGIWNEYRNCNIINFSSTLHKKCKSLGLSSYYIQYFPKPVEYENEGDESSIFFWQRRKNINTKTLEKVLYTNLLNKIYLHNVPDHPEDNIKPSEKLKSKIVTSNWFDTKYEMQKYIQKSALYFAPRAFEGIGMSFLEAMAAGRCVIAPDNPTMNEYIQHGKTGYLYNLQKPSKINLKNIRQIQKAAHEYIARGYMEWEAKKSDILKWLETPPETNSDKALMDEKLLVKNPERKGCFKIYTTVNSTTYKLFNLFPVLKNNVRKS